MPGTIGKYSIERVLGEGGFGKVYLAYDPDVGQHVAIKKIRAGGDDDLLKRFHAEIRTTASLRHKNIVTILASGEDAGDPYLVMEFLEGRTLKQVIHERAPLTLLERVRVMTQVAEGLAYAHSKGIVHRDVKPENIMLLPDDNVKIMDFGIALGPDRRTAMTQTGGIIGTPPYLAPEQLEGIKANPQTDIFSFGDVYYELLTGQHPFERFKGDWKSLHLAIMTYEPPSIAGLVPGCPEALETLVQRTLAKSPEFRYQTFEELQLDSEAIIVDLRHEGAQAILLEVRPLLESGNLQTALVKIRQAFQLEPGNREVRRLREEITSRLDRERVQGRVGELVAEAERQTNEGRFAEAVQSLEVGVKLDSTNTVLAGMLEEARARLDRYVGTNRLVSEARFLQQKGMLTEAQGRLDEARALDPENTEVVRLSNRVRTDLEKRRRDQERQQAIRIAQDHQSARRWAEALAVLDEIERRQPDAAGVAELRASIQRDRAEQARLQAERFNLAVSKTREALRTGDLDRAGPMLDHLFANFVGEPGASEILPELRQRLNALVRAKDVAQYERKIQANLGTKSYPAALALLAEAIRKYPDEAGFERLNRLAEDTYRAQLRAEAIVAVVKEATSQRDAGDLPGALKTVREGRNRLGEEAALGALAGQLEAAIERQRYRAGLERLLQDGGELMAAGKYSEAVGRIEGAQEFAAEAEVRALLDRARTSAAIELEQRFVEGTLIAAESLQSRNQWRQGLEAVERGLARYPQNSRLIQMAERLRERVEQERRRAAIEKHRATIVAEIGKGDWKRAEAALRQALSEFPADPAFQDVAGQVDAAIYEAGLREVETRVRESLGTKSITQAEQRLEAGRATYANNSRWKALAEEIARQKKYEGALAEAERQQKAGRLAEAETLLTSVIELGIPDKRADQLRGTIQVQRAEVLRQAEVARVTEGIRERLKRDDLAGATSELAVARARFPGENAWTELQSALDARKQALRRQSDLAAAEESVRQALGRDDLGLAASLSIAARKRFPGEAVWAALDGAIEARRAQLARQGEVTAIAERVRGWLQRHDIHDELRASADLHTALLERRRDNLRQAIRELDAARTRYPGDAVWATLQSEIDARREFLDTEDQIAERLSRALKGGDLDQAESQLATAKVRYPDENLWGVFESELLHYRELLKRWAEFDRISEGIRNRLQGGDVNGAKADLDAARVSYPEEGAWAALQAEIEARRAGLDREAEITAVREAVERLEQEIRDAVIAEAEAPLQTYPIGQVWDVLRKVVARLDQGRAKYPEEPDWDDLQAQATDRQRRLEREIVQIVRGCSALFPLDWNARQLAAARARYPGDPFWAVLEAEIAARREPLQRAAIAAFEARVRECLDRDDLPAASSRLSAARKEHPGARVWDELQAEIDARQSQLKRREEADAAECAVRKHLDRVAEIEKELEWSDHKVLQWEAFQSAAKSLAEARTKYPDEDRWPALQAEIDDRLAQWKREFAQGLDKVLRQYPGKAPLRFVSPQIRTLRAKEPDEPLWTRLCADLDAFEAQLQRDAEIAKQKAAAERRVQEEQKRREARDRDRDRLLAIARQFEAEASRRKQKALDREAQSIAAPYADDPEIVAIAAGIHARIDVVRVETPAAQAPAVETPSAKAPAAAPPEAAPPAMVPPQKPLPWKLIGGGAAAVAAIIAAVIFWPHPKPPEPPKLPPATTTVSVEIRTDPVGASVTVGDRTCKTPDCHLDLKPGSYQVEAKLPDYQPAQQSVVFDASNRAVSLTLLPVPPPPPPPGATVGTLVVSTGVPGALVYVDNVAQPGRTDQSGTATLSLEAKAHEIRVERNQYEKPAPQRVTLTANGKQTLTFRLIQQKARLELSGAPANLELRLDGKPFGRADGSSVYSFPAPVAPGDHTVEVSQGTLQGAQGSPGRSIRQAFDPGATVRLTWKADAVTPVDNGRGNGPGGNTVKPPTAEELEAKDWDKVKDTSDPAQLQDFRRRYPGGKHDSEAQSAIERLVWASTRKESLDSLRAYLQQFGNGPHAAEANAAIGELVWKGVDPNNPDQVRRFLAGNQNNPHAREAQQIIDQINKRDLALNQVKDVLDRFTAALTKNPSALKALWPGAPPDFLKPVAHLSRELTLADPTITGDRAVASGSLRTVTTQPKSDKTQSVTIELQNNNGQWQIVSFRAK